MMMIGLEFFVSNWAVKIPEESLKIVIGGVLSDFIFFLICECRSDAVGKIVTREVCLTRCAEFLAE